MLDEPRRGRRAPDLETNTAPDLLHDDLRRRDQPETPPDSMPPDEERKGEEPAGGGFTPKADGGNSITRSTTRIRRTHPQATMSGRSIGLMR